MSTERYVTTYEYGSTGEVTKRVVEEPDHVEVTTYEYDAAGNVTRVAVERIR